MSDVGVPSGVPPDPLGQAWPFADRGNACDTPAPRQGPRGPPKEPVRSGPFAAPSPTNHSDSCAPLQPPRGPRPHLIHNTSSTLPRRRPSSPKPLPKLQRPRHHHTPRAPSLSAVPVPRTWASDYRPGRVAAVSQITPLRHPAHTPARARTSQQRHIRRERDTKSRFLARPASRRWIIHTYWGAQQKPTPQDPTARFGN